VREIDGKENILQKYTEKVEIIQKIYYNRQIE